MRSLAAAGAARGLRPAAAERVHFIYILLLFAINISLAPAMEIMHNVVRFKGERTRAAEVVRLQWFLLRAPGA